MAGDGGKLATGLVRQVRPPVRDVAAENGRGNFAPEGRAGRLEYSGVVGGLCRFLFPLNDPPGRGGRLVRPIASRPGIVWRRRPRPVRRRLSGRIQRRDAGVQADGLFQVLDCLGVLAQLDAGHPPLVVGLGVPWVKGNGPVEIPNRFFVPVLAGQGYSPVPVSHGIVGPEANDPVLSGGSPSDVLPPDKTGLTEPTGRQFLGRSIRPTRSAGVFGVDWITDKLSNEGSTLVEGQFRQKLVYAGQCHL